jgi:hypothetical protein
MPLFIYGLFNDADSDFFYIMLNGRVVAELERVWKEVAAA